MTTGKCDNRLCFTRREFAAAALTAGAVATLGLKAPASRPAWASSVFSADAGGTSPTTGDDGISAIASTAVGERCSTPYYEFDLPAYWRSGKVAVSGPDERGTLTVLPLAYPSRRLMSVYVSDSSVPLDGNGDIGNACIHMWDDGLGHRIDLWVSNAVFLSQIQQFDDPEEEIRLVDLSTGGAYTVEEARASSQGSGSSDGFAFCDAMIGASLATPPGSLPQPISVLGGALPNARPSYAKTWDVAGLQFAVPPNAAEQTLPAPLTCSFLDLDTQVRYTLQTLGPNVEPRHFPLLAYRMAQLFEGTLCHHEQLFPNDCALDVYTVDYTPPSIPPGPSKGRRVLAFVPAAASDMPAMLFQCEVAAGFLDTAAGGVQEILESIRHGASISLWGFGPDENEAAYATLLASCYDRLAGYDAEISSAAALFNDTWAAKDLAQRQSAYDALLELQGRIQSEAVSLLCLSVPRPSAYRWNWEEISALVDDLDGRCKPIVSAWEKSLAYGADAGLHENEIMRPLLIANGDDGVNRDKRDYQERYPYARPA